MFDITACQQAFALTHCGTTFTWTTQLFEGSTTPYVPPIALPHTHLLNKINIIKYVDMLDGNRVAVARTISLFNPILFCSRPSKMKQTGDGRVFCWYNWQKETFRQLQGDIAARRIIDVSLGSASCWLLDEHNGVSLYGGSYYLGSAFFRFSFLHIEGE